MYEEKSDSTRKFISLPPQKCIVFAGAVLMKMECMGWKTGDGDRER